MRVALLYPEVYDMARFKEDRKEFPPFGVLYLAAACEQAGHEVAIERVTPLRTALNLSDFDAVGFSLASSATYGIMLDARNNSTISPDALVMVGGVHCNFYPESSLLDFRAHVAADGEAEETILEILGQARTRDFARVPGVLWPDGGTVHRTMKRPLMKSIDQLPLPARHLLPVEDFVLSDRLAGTDIKMAHCMCTRGCAFPCSFCAAGQKRMQYRSGASVRHELEALIEAYDIEGFAIVDDNFIISKPKVHDICQHINDLALRWSALSRVDTVDADLLKAMARSGCIEVKYGIESGSEPLLKAMRKNTKREQIKRAIGETVAAGIGAKAFIIHGYPGENAETTEHTISLLDELGDQLSRVSLFRFVPLPGTQVYDQADLHGITGTHLQPGWDGDWSKFHIHHNTRRWWGDDTQWQETQDSYARLHSFVQDRWGAQE